VPSTQNARWTLGNNVSFPFCFTPPLQIIEVHRAEFLVWSTKNNKVPQRKSWNGGNIILGSFAFVGQRVVAVAFNTCEKSGGRFITELSCALLMWMQPCCTAASLQCLQSHRNKVYLTQVYVCLKYRWQITFNAMSHNVMGKSEKCFALSGLK